MTDPMKIAMITDIHWGVKNDSQLFLDNMVKFYDGVFFPALEKTGVKTVFILGDTWDRRKYINIHTLHVAKKKFFNRFKELDIQVYMIYGNHDTFHKNTNEVNSVDMLGAEYDNIKVIDTHEILEFDGVKIGFISWINSGNLDTGLHFIKTADCSVLCGHFEIKSFEMVRGTVCEHGFDKTIFNRFEHVFSGHFHVVSSDGRISYLGNPHQTNWGDFGLKKGFWFFDTSTGEREFVENPFNLYEKIYYTDDMDLMKFDYDKYENKIVRIYVKSFEIANKKKLDLFVDRVGTKAFSVDLHEMTQGGSADDEDEVVDMVGSDTAQMIDQYIDMVGQSASFDKGKLRSYFMDIYNEAQERVITG